MLNRATAEVLRDLALESGVEAFAADLVTAVPDFASELGTYLISTIYIVAGMTGEYSDRSEWLVRAFASEEAAEAFCTLCVNAYEANTTPDRSGRRHASDQWVHPHDPGFNEDYTGTEYAVWQCDFGPRPSDKGTK